MARADVTVDESVDTYEGVYDPRLYLPSGTATPVPGPLDRIPTTMWGRYRREGYLAVANAFTETEIRDAIAGVDRLISGTVEGFRGIQWEAGAKARLATMDLDERRRSVRKLVYYVDDEPRLFALAHHPTVLGVVGELLGGEPELFADQALLKPAGIGREKPWHQDSAYFDLRPGSPVVGLWIALDAADVENGCMHVVLGSHRDGPVLHFRRRDFQICDTDVRTGNIVAVPLQPGGCLVFDGLLHHGTPKNTSSRRRWALQFHYARPADIWRSPEERAAYKQRRLDTFGGDGTDAEC